MNKINLHDAFVKALLEKNHRKSELTNTISDILRIERESASRRLNGKVQFSVQETGILAKEFGISLDALVQKEDREHWFSLLLQSPVMLRSMDIIYDLIDQNLERTKIIAQEPAEYGSVFNSLPVEFFIYYPVLTKFMFFKWGYYFVKTEEFDNFMEWKLPQRLSNLTERYEKSVSQLNKTLLIWDELLIASLVKEINNFYKMKIINTEEKNAIRDELKALLISLEQYIKGSFRPETAAPNNKFYVSSVNIGVTSCYCISETKHAALFQTNFIYSSIEKDRKNCLQIKDWIYSLRDISLLLSQSGHVERRQFFNNQHQTIDMALG